MTDFKPLTSRADLEAYALSVTLPVLDEADQVWDKVRYKGPHDNAGYQFSHTEQIIRPLWGLGPILSHRQGQLMYRDIDVVRWFQKAITAGSDVQSPYYWGKGLPEDMGSNFYNQMKTELCGLMIAFVTAKAQLWDTLADDEQKQIGDWVLEISEKAYRVCWPNNHVWFIVLNMLALRKLGLPYNRSIVDEGIARLDGMYMDNGWYKDGDEGRYDYYIPWAHHFYPLLWMMLEDEAEPGYAERKRKYVERTNAFLQYYLYFFDSTGAHVPFGRSLAYRYAVTSLLPLAVYQGCEIDPGLARAVTLRNIDFFRQAGAEDGKRIVPGYTYPNVNMIERYMSDGAPYWSSKAFLALLFAEDHPFWTAPARKLPIEEGDFLHQIEVPGVNLMLQGEAAGSGVTLYNNCMMYNYGIKFNDTAALYGKFAYNSRVGFGMSTRENVSLDSMIGLETPDGQLTSHRYRFEDLGERDGVLYSRQVPFSNDGSTVIKTALLPLKGGFHVRVHQVTLSQSYVVLEGGFSIGKPSDYECISQGGDWIGYGTEAGNSWFRIYGNRNELKRNAQEIHPSMHLMYPLAKYPVWRTTEPLEAGVHTFATCFHVHDKELVESELQQLYRQSPGIEVDSSKLQTSVTFQGETFVIHL